MAKKIKVDDFPDKIAADWLKQKMTIAEIEINREKCRQDAGITEKNEWYDREWSKFVKQIKSGDEIWEFSTPRRYWDIGFGYAGYVIIRAGNAVAQMMTKMN